MGPAMVSPAVPQKLGDHPAPSFQVVQTCPNCHAFLHRVAGWNEFSGALQWAEHCQLLSAQAAKATRRSDQGIPMALQKSVTLQAKWCCRCFCKTTGCGCVLLLALTFSFVFTCHCPRWVSLHFRRCTTQFCLTDLNFRFGQAAVVDIISIAIAGCRTDDLMRCTCAFLQEHKLSGLVKAGLLNQLKQMVTMRQLSASVDVVDLL